MLSMEMAGKNLFSKIYRKKQHLDPNHDIPFLAREIDTWLNAGIESLLCGNYSPRHLKRYYFVDEMVDQLHMTDRILQNLLYKQLKISFPYIINPNCLHINGPHGVKLATNKIQKVLEDDKYPYLIRIDIKSYYKSMQHHLLIKDIEHYFSDPKIKSMLREIIKNPIDTAKGTINPDNGIALRGPLSLVFSALYLKPLDDSFNKSEVFYLRYNDDIIILCQSLRQLNRCKQKVADVLRERKLSLSRKKSRIGLTKDGFHFVGVNYPGTQSQDNTISIRENDIVQNIGNEGGVERFLPKSSAHKETTPHPRTIRKARETVKSMVTHGFSTKSIKNYLYRWYEWWTKTNVNWTNSQMLSWFISTTHSQGLQLIAVQLRNEKYNKSHNVTLRAGVQVLAQESL